MDTKAPTSSSTSSYHHHRAPRTPESYFNVPESIALLNIVKSERIQSAFQSNRKNHASVWEMVAEVLNRFSARKRSAKQCCNRYENLKKIYTQLKKNPERHVRRNWPYMFLFKEIEEQRGECWGSANGKRLALIAKSQKELSYYHRRRQANELGLAYLGKDAAAMQHSLLHSLAHSTDSSSNNSKLDRFLPNHFVEAQLGDGVTLTSGNSGDANHDNSANINGGPMATDLTGNVGGFGGMGVYDEATPLQMQQAALHALRKEHEMRLQNNGNDIAVGAVDSGGGGGDGDGGGGGTSLGARIGSDASVTNGIARLSAGVGDMNNLVQNPCVNGLKDVLRGGYDKDCNGALNLHSAADNNISMKSEPMSEGEFNPDDIQLMQTNYNGSAQNFYPHHIDANILHSDVIVDTDNISDSSSVLDGGDGSGCIGVPGSSLKSKRKLSTTSTDGGDSTNFELIEYLKRREKRDEELLKRMDAREERILALLERTVVAFETLAEKCCGQSSQSNKTTN